MKYFNIVKHFIHLKKKKKASRTLFIVALDISNTMLFELLDSSFSWSLDIM